MMDRGRRRRGGGRAWRDFFRAVAVVVCFATGGHSAVALSPPPQDFVLRFFGPARAVWSEAALPLGLTSSFTIEGWFRFGQLDPGGVNPFVLAAPAGSPWLVVLGVTPAPDLAWNIQLPGGGMSGPPAVAGAWVHVAARASGTKVAFFLDGVKWGGELTLSAGVSVPAAQVLLGRTDVAVRQLRIWGVALSDGEVAQVAAAPPDPGDPRLRAWWPLDDAAWVGKLHPRIRDVSANGLHLAYLSQALEIGPQGRWVRPEVLDSGPHFLPRPLVPSGAPNAGDAGPPDVRFIDVDRDGDLDVYAVHRMHSPCAPIGHMPYFSGPPPQPDRLFRNDGAGPLADASAEILVGDRIQGFLPGLVAAGDFTGDGTADIFVAENGPECGTTLDSYGYPNAIRVGTVSGELWNESDDRLPSTPEVDHRAATVDVDGDGDLDVVSMGVGYPNSLFLNDGRGFFVRNVLAWPGSIAATSVVALDIDLDGDSDLFVGDNGNLARNTLLLNNGRGGFSPAPETWWPRKLRGLPYAAVHAMEARDIDRDGLRDLVVSDQPGKGGPETPLLQLLLGNGDGTFRDATVRIPQDWPPGRSDLPFGAGLFRFVGFDQNGDGWPDLAIPTVGVADQNLSTLLVNRGSAGFVDAGDLLPNASQTTYVDAADADSDGDDDLVFDFEFLENVKAWSPNPFPKVDLHLDLAVAPGSSAGSLVQTVRVENRGQLEGAPNVALSIPVPHGHTRESTAPAGGTCGTVEHVVVCRLAELAPGAIWEVAVRSKAQAKPKVRGTHAVASVTADVLDEDLGNNVARRRLEPPGPWLVGKGLAGFEFKALLGQGTAAVAGRSVSTCLPQTLCIAGSAPTRTDALVRVSGPQPNGFLWPSLVKLTTAPVELWLRQTATGRVQYYGLEETPTDSTALDGLFDREGFPTGEGAEDQGGAAAGEAVPPPPGAWLTATGIPGFRFKVRITAQKPILGRKAAVCLPNTLCVGGAAGTTDVLVRLDGSKPNGRLWPTMARFSLARVEVWIEQTRTRQIRHYLMAAAGATEKLVGVVDRDGFLP